MSNNTYQPSADFSNQSDAGDSYQRQLKTQQDMQQQQLQGQIDLQNKMIKDHNDSISQQQQSQLGIQSNNQGSNMTSQTNQSGQDQYSQSQSNQNQYSQSQNTEDKKEQFSQNQPSTEEGTEQYDSQQSSDLKGDDENKNEGGFSKSKLALGIGAGFLAAGAAYGGVKLNESRKNKKATQEEEAYLKNSSMNSGGNAPGGNQSYTSGMAGQAQNQLGYGSTGQTSHGSQNQPGRYGGQNDFQGSN